MALGYARPRDLELAGLACAALALGNAALIERAARAALEPFGPAPSEALATMDERDARALLGGFRYRFFSGDDVAALLRAASGLQQREGSLEAAFMDCADGPGPAAADYAGALSRFIRALGDAAPRPWPPNLLPDPARGSASKRSFLYLRWMVRRDAVDPGPWTTASPARLVVPMDTHMAAACRRLGLVTRRSTDLKAAIEATVAFRRLRPDDPVRYDFCLTRPGIRPDLDPDLCFGDAPGLRSG